MSSVSGSILHYSAYGFAIDPTVPTIIVPEGVEIGQRIGFSEVLPILITCIAGVKFEFNLLALLQVDLYKLNVLYNCSARSN